MADSSFLDVEALRSSAKAGMRELFEELRSRHGDDRIYGVGFYSHEGNYLCATAFSERGLDETVDEYETRSLAGDRPYLKPKQRDEWHRELRWSPCDSPLHTFGDSFLRDAESVIKAANTAYETQREVGGPDWDPDYDKSADLRDKIYDTLVDVLCSLDAEGVFDPNRERLVLSIWEGDQSYEDRVRFATRCNPAEVAARFAAEELASYS